LEIPSLKVKIQTKRLPSKKQSKKTIVLFATWITPPIIALKAIQTWRLNNMKSVNQMWMTYDQLIEQPYSVLKSIRKLGGHKNNHTVYVMAGFAVQYIESIQKLNRAAKNPGQISEEKRKILSLHVRHFGSEIKRYLGIYKGEGSTIYSQGIFE
jgi:hypothetical protein